MYLIGKDYKASKDGRKALSTQKKTSLKAKVKTFCPKDKKRSYEEIIDHIRKDAKEYYTNDELVKVIEAVKKEDDYKLPEPKLEKLKK